MRRLRDVRQQRAARTCPSPSCEEKHNTYRIKK